MRGQRFVQRGSYRFKNIVGSLENIIIPESQDAESQRFERSRTALVIRNLIEMLAAIQLDGEATFERCEVEDVTRDAMLTPEFRAELRVAQMSPKQCFRVGLRLAETFCVIHAPAPHPALSPKR